MEKRLPWLDGGEGSVKEHLEKALEWFSREENYGPHGLPKIHHADWNDALNIPDEEAESVFMGMLICKVYDEMSELFEYSKLSIVLRCFLLSYILLSVAISLFITSRIATFKRFRY